MSWEMVRFGDLYGEPSRNGISVSRNQHDGSTNIVNMGELFASDYVGDSEMRRIKVDEAELRRFCLAEGDLLFARRSLVASGAGRAALVSRIKEPTVFESSIIRVRLNQERAYPRFYLYWLKSFAGRDAVSRLVTGTNVKGIRGSELSEVKVPLPPLNEQMRIANILSAYDKLIENSRKQIALLEETAQRLYKEWFVDLRFPGYETTPIIDGLPEGWGRGSLFDLCTPIRGCSYSSEEVECGEGTLINLGNLAPYGGFRFGYEKPFSGKCRDDQLISKGDVFIGLTEQAKGLAGYAALVPAVPKGSVISADLMRLMPLEGASSVYLYGLLRFGRLSDELSPLANGTKIKHLRPDAIARINFVVPPISLINKYSDFVAPLFEKVSGLLEQTASAREARDRLLPKLMSGEIEVG